MAWYDENSQYAHNQSWLRAARGPISMSPNDAGVPKRDAVASEPLDESSEVEPSEKAEKPDQDQDANL